MMGVLEGWVQWVWLLVSLSFTRDRTWLQCLVSFATGGSDSESSTESSDEDTQPARSAPVR